MGEGWGEGEIRTHPLTPTPCTLVNHPPIINLVRLKLVNQPTHPRQRFQVDGHPVSKNRKSAQVRPQARIASTPRSDPSQRTPLRCVLRPGPHRPGLSERNQGLKTLRSTRPYADNDPKPLAKPNRPPPDHHQPPPSPPDQKELPSPTFLNHRHPAQNPVYPVHRCKNPSPTPLIAMTDAMVKPRLSVGLVQSSNQSIIAVVTPPDETLCGHGVNILNGIRRRPDLGR